MADGKNWMRHIMDSAELYGESLPRVPLLELAGDSRVLIECHCGVLEYTSTLVTVRVCYGQISIAGYGLEIAVMSRQCLVISGRIDNIRLDRKEDRHVR